MASPIGSAEESVASALAALNAAAEEAVGHHKDALRARRAGDGDLVGICVERRNRSAREATELAKGIIAAWSGNLGVESLVYQAISPAEHGRVEWHRWA